MTEQICEHGSQIRKCMICECIDCEQRSGKAVDYLKKVDEKECSIGAWDAVQNAIEILE